MMEILEFLRQRKRMCDYYGDDTCVCDDSRGECPALDIDCSFATDHPEYLIAIVEQWAKEHPEEAADATKPKNDDPCATTIQDAPEGAIYREIISHKTRIENLEYDVSVIRQSAAKMADTIYALNAKVDYTLKMKPSQTLEPKLTNKDVLLAAFPRMVMDGDVPASCPRIMDRDIHIQHCAGRSCDECRHEYWLAEADEN